MRDELYRQAERYHGYTLAGWRHQITRCSGKPHLFTEGGELLEMSISEWGDVWVSAGPDLGARRA